MTVTVRNAFPIGLQIYQEKKHTCERVSNEQTKLFFLGRKQEQNIS